MNQLFAFFLVFIGGGSGSMVRYAIALLVGPFQERFPLATLISNVLACMVLGWTLGLFGTGGMNDQRKLLIATGFCGGFSTFSTFTAENHALWQSGQTAAAIGNIIFNIAICWTAFWAGFKMV